MNWEVVARAAEEASTPPWKPLASSSSGKEEGDTETESRSFVEPRDDGTVATRSHRYT